MTQDGAQGLGLVVQVTTPSAMSAPVHARARREAARHRAGRGSNLAAAALLSSPASRTRGARAFIAFLHYLADRSTGPLQDVLRALALSLTQVLDAQRVGLEQPRRPEPPPQPQQHPLVASPNAPPQRLALVPTGAAA